ncbi:MAG TPA: YbfB/YjiJ family MFS transporter [Geminicoccaceae bacterium]
MRQPAGPGREHDEVTRWVRGAVSGLCAILVGIGLARFAYTPLIPALIEQGWFSPGGAAYLGAANLAGYFVGALVARKMATLRSPLVVLRANLALATLAFFGCAFPAPFLWFFLWRLLAGIAGGVLMVLAAPTLLPHVPLDRRGRAGGIVFTGVGIGIASSGLLVPALLRLGLTETWLGLGLLALILTVIGWSGWPAGARTSIPPPRSKTQSRARAHPGLALKALFVEYGLNATGLVPHMVFLVDFVARGLVRGIDTGSVFWIVFGLGAMAGPLLAGMLGDRIGFGRAFRLALIGQTVMILLLVVPVGLPWIVASSVVIGAAAPGIVPLVLGRVQELLPGDPEGQGAAWRVATMAFALGQAAGAYGLSFVFDRTQDYALLFALGGGAVAAALALEVAVALVVRRQAARPCEV